jgi:hypothetical protein
METALDQAETKGSIVESTYELLPHLPPKAKLVNYLLEMFCIKWLKMSKEVSQVLHPHVSYSPHFRHLFFHNLRLHNDVTHTFVVAFMIMADQNWMQTDNMPSVRPSPWILPVHVVSNRQDQDRHAITKIAKCTIDTGNMQGNIVSKDFVESVLEFPSTGFEKLTSEEEMSGTSITGDLHTPLGAIYLTWYHSSSTRVFRNMRFLISPAQYCDMIIGAQSIQKEKILSVPCLVDGTFIRGDLSMSSIIPPLSPHRVDQ